MYRRFQQHQIRRVIALNGIWDFVFLGEVEPDAVDIGSIEFSDRMAVPGCFDAMPAWAGKRGLTAYRTSVYLTDQPQRLILDGVHHWCRVFVGNNHLCDHVGGFTRFSTDIAGHQPGQTEIVVLVDNRFDFKRCPLHQEYFDWYHYGGITRGAELHQLGSVWIDSLKIVTTDYARRRLCVSIDYAAIAGGSTDMAITCDGQEILSEKLQIAAGTGCLERTFELPGAALWSPDEPNLLMIAVRLGDDDMRERIGIRQVSTNGRDILINDQPLRLLGVNRHESHGQFGCALPEALLVADIQQLRQMGCNFVRGSHYPQDVRFLDLCDEAGICVWSESIGWQHTAEDLTDEQFMRAQLTNIDEMVACTVNRPSVILWGVQNESDSDDPRCRPAYQRLLSRLQQLDPTRPLTYASDRPFKDICFDLADVISINCYPGWYPGQGEIAEIPAQLDRIVEHLDSTGQASKPIIISEIGAGAIWGWRDLHQTRWSEQYQARVLETAIRHLFVDRDRVCGICVWQFCDCRASQQATRSMSRPRGFNNKGLVDEYRRPKLAFEVVGRCFKAIADRCAEDRRLLN